MAGLVFLGTLLLLTGIIVYWRASLVVWSVVLGCWLLISAFDSVTPVWSLLFGWSFWALVTVFGLVGSLRQAWVSGPVYNIFRKIVPSISQTEEEALNAGDNWWEEAVFSGKPDWQCLLDKTLSTLSPEEQAFLDNETTTLCSLLDDWHITHEAKDLPPEIWRYIKEQGFFGLVIDKSYGGKGFSAAAHSAVVMKLATRSLTAAVTVMVPNSLGPGELLHHYGTAEQKQRFLPALATGEEVPCFALTGPDAGSDATAIPDEGIVCMGEHDGQEVLGIRLTFNKRYITLAPVATLVGLAFKLYDPEHLLGSDSDIGITCCLIPRSHPGLVIGHRHVPLDLAFMNGTISGENVFVPIDWVIGGREMVGQGWRMLVECLSIGRAISLPALGTANGLFCSVVAGAYSRIREQFNMPVGQFEGIEKALARIGGMSYLMNATRVLTYSAVDQGIKPSVASAIAKYHITEMGRTVINDAMDIHGGRGIILGPRNYLGRAYQGIPISITVEGANILTRNLIIFGQGAMRAHPYLLDCFYAALNEDTYAGAQAFDKSFCGYVGFYLSNLSRAFWLSWTQGWFCFMVPKIRMRQRLANLNMHSARFAWIADMCLMVLGGALKRKERISARLGDAMSYLYMASAVVKHFVDHGRPADEKVMRDWALNYCEYHIQEALLDVIDHFPSRPLAWLMRMVAFPWGRRFKRVDFRLDHRLSKSMLKSSRYRDTLKEQVYVPDNPEDMVGCLEHAFSCVQQASDIYATVKGYVRQGEISRNLTRLGQCEVAYQQGLITEDEWSLIVLTEKARSQAIAVDSFETV